jgi:hypothetical protein
MDMVMNARSPADLDHVYALTLTLLQYRADPNVHIATTEPMICHSQSSVFLKKSSHQVLYYYVQVCRFFHRRDVRTQHLEKEIIMTEMNVNVLPFFRLFYVEKNCF